MTDHNRGYLIPVLSVCVTVLTLGFLALTLYAAKAEDKAQYRGALTASYYAAESGLEVMNKRLENLKAAPAAGAWLTGELSSTVRFRVVVSSEERTDTAFTLTSLGQAEGEQAALILSELDVRVEKQSDGTWKTTKRKR